MSLTRLQSRRNQPMQHDPSARDQVEIVDHGGGEFAILGPLTFDTARRVMELSKPLFVDHDIIHIDLADVTDSDSAGLALLLEWVNWGRHYVHEIRYENVPEQIQAIARISEVSDLLAAGERWTGPLTK
jgi:phospholipid transport system transporter-binding protein